MGGGAQIAPGASNTAEQWRLVLQSSYPLDADTWHVAVAAMSAITGASTAFSVTPYVICN
jgi:hypothetical protein